MKNNNTISDRIKAWIDAIPGAVAGSGGHNQTFSVTCGLTNGWARDEPDAVEYLSYYNQKCDPPWSEKELIHKVRSAMKANHAKPRGHLLGESKPPNLPEREVHAVKVAKPKDPPTGMKLPAPIPEGLRVLLQKVYEPGEFVRIVPGTYGEEETADEPKDQPVTGPDGKGVTLSVEHWLEKFEEKGFDPNKMWHNAGDGLQWGLFIGMNPVKNRGSKDSDVTSFRHALIEFDDIPKEAQWQIITESNVPCSAVIDSGGRSIHAWVRVDAKDSEEYVQRREVIQNAFSEYGADLKNKNPSRLSRLPGCKRGHSRQELLATDIGAESFEEWLGEQKERDLAWEEITMSSDIPAPVSVLKINGITVGTQGNVIAFVGDSKAGKSSALTAAMSATIAGPVADVDTFNITSSNIEQKAMLYIDSEQAKAKSFETHEKILRRALGRAPKKGENGPPWFRQMFATGVDHATNYATLLDFAAIANKKHNGIHSIYIDQIGDFLCNVNDPEESDAFVRQLQALAIEYSCLIVLVLHVNPNSEKGRGHVGSQLQRKCESNIAVVKDADQITTIYGEMMRGAPIFKQDGPRFRYDHEADMHVTCSTAAAEKLSDKEKIGWEYINAAFGDKPSLKWKDFHAELMKLSLKESTAGRRITEWTKMGLIGKSVCGLYERIPVITGSKSTVKSQ